MIVQATEENLWEYIDGLKRCADEFTQEARSEALRHYVMDRNVFFKSWLSFLKVGMGCLLILLDDAGEVAGALGGCKYADPNNGRMTLCEMFWFVREDARGGGMELFRQFEDWGRANGCEVFQMVHLRSVMPDVMARLYERCGYHECETIYRKEV